MHIESLAIPEVKLLVPKKHGDQRGFFSEVYNKAAFSAASIDIEFLQDNHSRSAERGTVREASRHEKLIPGRGRKLHTNMVAVGG